MEGAAQKLMARAMENGGEDNITVVLVAFDPDQKIMKSSIG
jgi:serine/threonine protein phosphatase PrpC